MMRLRRNASVLAVATALMLSATGCGGDDVPTAEPTETTTSATPTESTSPTETDRAWQDKYTEAQLDAYEAALARYETYEDRTEPIWSEGKATDRAEALFKQYYPSPLWQGQFRLLSNTSKVPSPGVASPTCTGPRPSRSVTAACPWSSTSASITRRSSPSRTVRKRIDPFGRWSPTSGRSISRSRKVATGSSTGWSTRRVARRGRAHREASDRSCATGRRHAHRRTVDGCVRRRTDLSGWGRARSRTPAVGGSASSSLRLRSRAVRIRATKAATVAWSRPGASTVTGRCRATTSTAGPGMRGMAATPSRSYRTPSRVPALGGPRSV